MMDYRSADYVSPSWVTDARVTDGDSGMFRVVARYKNPTMVPDHVILWEPSLMRLPVENTREQADAALVRLVEQNPTLEVRVSK